MCNLQPPGQDRNSLADLDSQLQEQERIINISYALASEASQRSKQVAGKATGADLRGQFLPAAPSITCPRARKLADSDRQLRVCSLSCLTQAGEEVLLSSVLASSEPTGQGSNFFP